MRSILLPEYNKNIIRAMLSLRTETLETPVPLDNEVLIRTHAAPVNPSDIAFLQGVYNIVKPLPAIPGFEGSGYVVGAGKHAGHLVGKKVSAFVQEDKGGTWSDHFIAYEKDVLVLDDDMDMDQAACFTVNPFTAYGLFRIAMIRESKAIIQNAAGGQVAAFIRTMAEEQGIETINIVRKAESAEKLKNLGTRHVLTETDEHFSEELETMANQLSASTAFDAVGGALSGTMLHAMPPDAELVVYGGLSNKPMSQLPVIGVIFHNKILSGFNLVDWKSELEEGAFEEISAFLQKKCIEGTYTTTIQGSCAMEDIVKGMKSYISDMSAGKLLIKP